MPHLSSNLCDQIFLFDTALYYSHTNPVSYGSVPSQVEVGFDPLDEPFDDYCPTVRDDCLSATDGCTVSFWGDNWLSTLNGCSDGSYGGVFEPQPDPDDDLGLISWRSYDHHDLDYEFSQEGGVRDMASWENNYEYEYFDDEGLCGWMGGFPQPYVAFEGEEKRGGGGEVVDEAKQMASDHEA